jgi:uncharacterized lipoprotein YddW (UPF0748 family)
MKRITIICLALASAISIHAQPIQEFRGVWVATVANLDWPTSRTATVAAQQADLIAHFDQLKAAGVNAILFQVRTEADALYASSIEPWSYYLTGVEGQAPNPFWDPLEFAIREAHKRGMELHAWLNPYRADRVPGLFTRASNHVTVTNPEWIITATSASSSIKIMNPGIPAVRNRITAVVMDIVRRYDVDGIHFDDYFYPYPPNDMGFSTARWDLDKATFEQYGAGFSIRSDWRRNNINTMVKAVHDSIKSVKPHVKFGISPFGIWKSGTPSGITGMNAFDVIYADALQWLSVKSVDYITPQLYWRFGGGQDYGKLAPWWSGFSEAAQRHHYPGLAAYQLAPSTSNPTGWLLNDITSQLRLNRSDARIQGEVLFRSRSVGNNTKNISDTLRTHYYREPAITPHMPWLPQGQPAAPLNLTASASGDFTRATLTWSKPSMTSATADTTLFYLITKAGIDRPLALTGQTTYTDPTFNNTTATYRVQAIGRNGAVGPAAEALVATSIDRDGDLALQTRLEANYPNPFNPSTVLRWQLAVGSQTRLVVYDIMGREIAVLAQGVYPAGRHEVVFDASGLASGVYIYTLETGGQRFTKRMTLLK